MAHIKKTDDDLIVELDVEEFLKSSIQPHAEARMGGSVVAYAALDKLRKHPKYAEVIDQFKLMTSSYKDGKLVVRFHNTLDLPAPSGVQ